jgi:hypothetical protein
MLWLILWLPVTFFKSLVFMSCSRRFFFALCLTRVVFSLFVLLASFFRFAQKLARAWALCLTRVVFSLRSKTCSRLGSLSYSRRFFASLKNLLALGDLNVGLNLLYLLSGITLSLRLDRQARASF